MTEGLILYVHWDIIIKRITMYKSIIKNGYKFLFKYDYDPISKDYLPHIWIRHLIKPEDVVNAFFSIEKQDYNNIFKRYEAYSTKYNMTIYFFYYKDSKNIIVICSAFGGNNSE